MDKAKITPRFRIYDLRHTFGSRLAMAGVDLPTLKELMGHSHISTTMRYVHPTPAHKQDAMRKLEKFNAEQDSQQSQDEGSPQKSPQASVLVLPSRDGTCSQVIEMAERGGFEPPVQVLARTTV
jgi:hypothetical protein